MKSIFQSKTVWFGVLYTVVQFAGLVGYGDYTPPAGLVDTLEQIIGLVMIGLRLVTREGVRLPF